MTKRELWDVFMRTGRVSDYLKYKKVRDQPAFDTDEDNLTETAEEIYKDFPGAET